MNESVIRTGGLTKRYGDILAVDDLSLEVPGGQVFGLLGPNGSGKTTTMGMLLGLVKQTAGSFSLFGSGTPHQNALHRVGAIVETPSFYPYLSGRDNLAYYQGITGRGNRKELDDLLSKVGLADRAKNRFRTYSLRMKQRLGLAYALLDDPELLFLDEPTRRRTAGRLGKMPTTSVRRRISLLRRSRGLLDQIFFQWASGKLEKARTSGPASSSREATCGNGSWS